MHRITLVLCAALAAGPLAPATAAQRAFVSSGGSDANTATSCGPSAPCRSFAAAMTVVDAGGDVIALDAAGYGAVTINKSVTLTANPGFYAGIAASTGNAITIGAPGISVTLRGLNINGIGANGGVAMTDGAALSIENCVITNFTTYGVYVYNVGVRIIDTVIRGNENGVYVFDGAKVAISSSRIVGNTNMGVLVFSTGNSAVTRASIVGSSVDGNGTGVFQGSPDATSQTYVAVTGSSTSYNQYGILTGASSGTAVATINGNTVVGNSQIGVAVGIGTTIESTGNNTVRQNAIDVSGVVTTIPAI